MRGIQSSIDAIVSRNRQNAVSKMTVKGGEAGKALAKAARLSQEVIPGTVVVDDVQYTVFILGLHPMTDDYWVL